MITSLEQLDFDKTYSYADYLTWQFDQFVELFRGKVFPMSSPSRNHQKISSNLHVEIGIFLRENPCEVYAAPFDVRFPKKRGEVNEHEIYTVVQPDLCVICDLEKLDDKGCLGAPEFIIEIISESNAERDLKYKFALYEENGVLEYWVVRPSEKTVECFLLSESKYVFKGIFTHTDKVTPQLFPSLQVDLQRIFKDI